MQVVYMGQPARVGYDGRINDVPAHNPLAIVTGASSGIGRETASLLAQRGYRVVLIARHVERLESLAQQLPHGAVAMPMDLSDVDVIGPAMRNLLETHGPAQVLVNNAGSGQFTPFLETSMIDERGMFDLLYHAPSAMIRALLPAMLDRGRGLVINVCSISARIGPWGHSSYAAAKAALVSLTQTLAAEHADSGVHFSYVNPGIVRTAFFDRPDTCRILEGCEKRAITPQAVAQAIAGLLDRPRLEVCIPASYRLLDMVTAISPALAHRIVASASRPPTEARDAAPRDGADTPPASDAP